LLLLPPFRCSVFRMLRLGWLLLLSGPSPGSTCPFLPLLRRCPLPNPYHWPSLRWVCAPRCRLLSVLILCLAHPAAVLLVFAGIRPFQSPGYPLPWGPGVIAHFARPMFSFPRPYGLSLCFSIPPSGLLVCTLPQATFGSSSPLFDVSSSSPPFGLIQCVARSGVPTRAFLPLPRPLAVSVLLCDGRASLLPSLCSPCCVLVVAPLLPWVLSWPCCPAPQLLPFPPP
jgi:hypothetical protein